MALDNLVRIGLLTLTCSACAPGPADEQTRRPPPPRQPIGDRPSPAELERAAVRIILFLQGRAGLDEPLLADSVTLVVATEGGGASIRRSRRELRDPARWRIPAAEAGGSYLLVPPVRNTELTTRVGAHFNCLESSLAHRRPELAHLPHVGTRLMPPAHESCLEAWNATLVFRHAPGRPVLVAVVHDQWEW